MGGSAIQIAQPVDDAPPSVHLAAPARSNAEGALDTGLREQYYRLLHADAHPDAFAMAARVLNEHFAHARHAPLDAWLEPLVAPGAATEATLRERAAAARATARATWVARIGALAPDRHAWLAMHAAPWMAIDGCWLQHTSSALSSHEEVASVLLRSYLRRVDAPGKRGGQRYADALRELGADMPASASHAFASHPEIAEPGFELPLAALALSQFPTLLRPETLGFNLFCALRGSDPLASAIAATHPQARRLQELACPERAARLLDDAFAALACAPVEWRRLLQGVRLGQVLHGRRDDALAALANGANSSPQARMEHLIRRKAAVAAGYHGRRRIGGRNLDELFLEAQRDPRALVAALAQSHHVRPGAPQDSPLVTSLVSPRGAMAGVFDGEEIAIILSWIRDLAAMSRDAPPAICAGAPDADTAPAADRAVALLCLATEDAEKHYARLPLRTLYHHLLHVETYPDVLPYARTFASWWLARCAIGLDKGEQPIPFAAYDHRAFDDWLAQRHSAQMLSYAEAAAAGPPPPARADLIESCIQLCPMVYIDGAWLQRMGQVGLCAGEVGSRLHRIYLDEVGNGDARENHANLYRELMASMEVAIPAFGTPEFAHWPRFADAAFRLPVFWLCISQFPRHFLAETLGLNLAVELSGVGSTYRSSSDALRHHRYSSTFVDVHNTIDNVSSGHTALAHQAIKAHLDDGLEQGGPDEVQRRWKRVWTGWRAIVAPAGVA